MQPLLGIAKKHTLVGIVESAPRGWHNSRPSFFYRLRELLAAVLGTPSLWLFAHRNNIPYYFLTRQNIEQFKYFLQQLQADIGCIASMNHLLPESIISVTRLGFINFHPSVLPKYRGPHAWFWHYYDMEKEGGATIHFIDGGEDTGDIIKQASFPIELGMEPQQLIHNAIDLGARLMVDALEEIATGTVQKVAQRHMPCPRRGRYLKANEDLFLWREWSLERSFHFLSGTYPWYYAFNGAPGILKWIPWRASRYQPSRLETANGKIRWDRQGFYFCHPEGKIRLRAQISLFRLVLLSILGLYMIIELLTG